MPTRPDRPPSLAQNPPSAGVAGIGSRLARAAGAHAWPWLVLCAALLLLFVDKPVHIDDPLFLWEARQILSSPADPFGFDVNWYGIVQPIHHVTCNPPLAAYLLAASASLFGWEERAFHLVFLLPALVVVLGTHALAKRWTASPGWATAALLGCPTFLVSASTLMCDVLMLAFWVTAIVCWVKGMEAGSRAWLLAGAACALGAILSKYFGAAVLGLMGLYSWRRAGLRWRWSLILALPLVGWLAYETWGWRTYGHVLLFHAGSTVDVTRSWTGSDLIAHGLATLTFVGGSAAFALVALPDLVRGRARIAVMLGTGLCACLFLALVADGEMGKLVAKDSLLSIVLQAAVWMAVAIAILALLVHELRTSRDPVSLVLAAWILGTVTFAWFLNWSVNGRTVLPLLPATAILVVRRFDRGLVRRRLLAAGIASGIVLSLLVTAGDDAWARSQRDAARSLARELSEPGRPVWFQGHWGFQWYAEASGARHQVRDRDELQSGDRVVAPLRNTNVWGVPDRFVRTSLPRNFPSSAFIVTLDPRAGAGFYSSVLGPLPFALGLGEPDVVWVFEVE